MILLVIGVGTALLINLSEPKTVDIQEYLSNLEEDYTQYPLYRSLNQEEKYAYAMICNALKEFNHSTAKIYTGSSRREVDEFGDRMVSLYRDIVYEQSEYFWVDPYYCELKIVEIDGVFTAYIEPKYILDKNQADTMKGTFNLTLERIVSEAEKKEDDFQKILYVYDYILEHCEYDDTLIEHNEDSTVSLNAYGCLVDGRTVCSGYTLAFDAVLKRLGYECGAEFNNYSGFSIFTGHVWNYCKIEDDYYYFDLTWDDTGFRDEKYRKYFDHSHTYFAISKEELSKSNYTLSPDAPTPYCGGTKYNYFNHYGYNLKEYDPELAEEIILSQSSQNFVVLRFDDYSALLKARIDLIDNDRIFTILSPVTRVSYVSSNSNLHLYIFPEQ